MEQYQDIREMSMDLNNAFDDSIYSEYVRHFKYVIDPVCEVLQNSDLKVVGSTAEGTDDSGSDQDVLILNQNGVEVGYNSSEAGTDSDKPYLLLTRGPLTPPGYTKLQVYLNDNHCQNSENTELQSFFTHEIEKYNSNTIFLTNRKLIENFYPLIVTDHGPAQTIQMSYDKTMDEVIAYESKILPIDMKSWFQRPRLKRWPSKETCELFKSMGCCYVAVGHSNSSEQELEWRISPTRQELYLMLNLNPTQFRCYILLKLIKRYLHKHCCDGISSYHCKTALFWTIEKTEITFWQPQNLIVCVLKCLKLLHFWVKKKKCPNYFIPKENMFETKVLNQIQLDTLQKVIKNYFRICMPLWLPVIKRINQKSAIIEMTQGLKQCLSKTAYGASSKHEHGFHTFHQYIELIKTKPRNVCIHEFEDLLSPHKIDIDILLEMLEKKLRCLNRTIHLKSILESNTFTEENIMAYINDPSKESLIDYEYGLKIASIIATRGANITCDVLLQGVHRMTKLAIYCCCYSSTKRYETQHLIQENISKNIKVTRQFINKLSITDILQRVSFCLQFVGDREAGIAMTPLHFDEHKTVGMPSEMISITVKDSKYDSIDLVSIHPTAYLYYLQYKNSEMMNKKGDMCAALAKLEDINLVSLQKGIYSHPDTTLNLLGHIYTNRGWYRLAVQCYRKSWLIEPHYNAVKWHVIFLMFCKQI